MVDILGIKWSIEIEYIQNNVQSLFKRTEVRIAIDYRAMIFDYLEYIFRWWIPIYTFEIYKSVKKDLFKKNLRFNVWYENIKEYLQW